MCFNFQPVVTRISIWYFIQELYRVSPQNLLEWCTACSWEVSGTAVSHWATKEACGRVSRNCRLAVRLVGHLWTGNWMIFGREIALRSTCRSRGNMSWWRHCQWMTYAVTSSGTCWVQPRGRDDDLRWTAYLDLQRFN